MAFIYFFKANIYLLSPAGCGSSFAVGFSPVAASPVFGAPALGPTISNCSVGGSVFAVPVARGILVP